MLRLIPDSEKTRVRQNWTIIILTNDEGLIDKLDIVAPLWKSDHVGIEFRILANVVVQQGDLLLKRNYWKANWDKIKKEAMNINWVNLLGSQDIEAMWNILKVFCQNGKLDISHLDLMIKKDKE